MPLMNKTSANTVEMNGVSFVPIAAPSRGSQESVMWRTTVSPNTPGALHHLTREELILAVSGTALVHIGEESHPLAPGDAFAVPAFTDFRVDCVGDTPFEFVAVLPVGGRAVMPGKPAFALPWSL